MTSTAFLFTLTVDETEILSPMSYANLSLRVFVAHLPGQKDPELYLRRTFLALVHLPLRFFTAYLLLPLLLTRILRPRKRMYRKTRLTNRLRFFLYLNVHPPKRPRLSVRRLRLMRITNLGFLSLLHLRRSQ